MGQNGEGGAGGKADESIDNMVYLCRFTDDLKSWLTEHPQPSNKKTEEVLPLFCLLKSLMTFNSLK